MSEHTQGGYEALKTSHECKDCGMEVFHEYVAPSPDEREALGAEFAVFIESGALTKCETTIGAAGLAWNAALARLRAVGRDAEQREAP